MDGAAGNNAPTSTLSPVPPSVATQPPIIQGTATTRPFPTFRPLPSGSGLETSFPISSSLQSPLAPVTGATHSQSFNGIEAFLHATGIVGSSRSSGLLATGPRPSDSTANNSWTFSKSGMTIAPTLASSVIQTRVETKIPTLTETYSMTTTGLHSPPKGTPTESPTSTPPFDNKSPAADLPMSSTSSGPSSKPVITSSKPLSFTGGGTKLSGRYVIWSSIFLVFYIVLNHV
ncbi:hypothetical protein ABVK25_010791 [Lepraria finkii]|uniref:Uncharacterized protein n=1 Tax=Lepraria finkii TaxID=1340010 RepID=A0ABR4AZK7_9LECA